MKTQETLLQELLIAKENKIASIVGSKKAKVMIERSLQLIKSGKKSITDLLSVEELQSIGL